MISEDQIMFCYSNKTLDQVCLYSACTDTYMNNFFLSPVAEGPYAEVVKLQTMRCLFEAYEHVLSLLENVFTPMFCHSDEVGAQTRNSSPRLIVVEHEST